MGVYCKLTRTLCCTISFTCAMLFLIGCGGFDQSAKRSEVVWEDVEYTTIDINAIENEQLLAWIDEHYREQGVHVFKGKSVLGKYVLIAAGEKPTGGYTLQIDQVKGSADEIKIITSVIQPKKGDFVTQGFTYPYLMIQIQDDRREIVLDK